ncbi:SOS response-associated peptidase [Agreia pratensis]|nr:SOS response-associated peptidase [Agreia pratensis]
MCGRFAMDKETDDLIQEFVAQGGDFRDWAPSWNIAPTDTIPVLLDSAKDDGGDVRRLEPARWSLVPSYSKEVKLKYPTFNARAEGLASKATWRGPLKSHRAIIPATGYYEWKTERTRKTPHFIHLPGEMIGMAGLYSWWPDHSKNEDDDDFWTLTATILTSDAVDQLIGIHDRNPVPLPRDLWDWWLDPTIAGDQAMVDAAVKAALPVASELEAYEVGPVRGDGPELIMPV